MKWPQVIITATIFITVSILQTDGRAHTRRDPCRPAIKWARCQKPKATSLSSSYDKYNSQLYSMFYVSYFLFSVLFMSVDIEQDTEKESACIHNIGFASRGDDSMSTAKKDFRLKSCALLISIISIVEMFNY